MLRMSNTPLFTRETNIENVNYTETWMRERERESWKPMRNLAGNNETFVKNWPHSQDKLVPIAKSVSVDTYTRKTDFRLRDDASNSEHLFFLFFLNISARVIVTGTSLNLSLWMNDPFVPLYNKKLNLIYSLFTFYIIITFNKGPKPC